MPLLLMGSLGLIYDRTSFYGSLAPSPCLLSNHITVYTVFKTILLFGISTLQFFTHTIFKQDYDVIDVIVK